MIWIDFIAQKLLSSAQFDLHTFMMKDNCTDPDRPTSYNGLKWLPPNSLLFVVSSMKDHRNLKLVITSACVCARNSEENRDK